MSCVVVALAAFAVSSVEVSAMTIVAVTVTTFTAFATLTTLTTFGALALYITFRFRNQHFVRQTKFACLVNLEQFDLNLVTFVQT